MNGEQHVSKSSLFGIMPGNGANTGYSLIFAWGLVERFVLVGVACGLSACWWGDGLPRL